MSDQHQATREITVSNEMLFPDVETLTGMVERPSAGGFMVRATRANNLIEYSAVDAHGAHLPGEYLRMRDGAPHVSPLDTCFFCVTSRGVTYCTEVLCPERPV
jgi:hypothetical protein